MALSVSDKNEAELWFHRAWGTYEFSPGFTAEGRRTGVEPVNYLAIIHIMQYAASIISHIAAW